MAELAGPVVLELVAEDGIAASGHALDEIHTVELPGHRRMGSEGETGAQERLRVAQAAAVVRLAPVAGTVKSHGPAEMPGGAVAAEDHVSADMMIGLLLSGQGARPGGRDGG